MIFELPEYVTKISVLITSCPHLLKLPRSSIIVVIRGDLYVICNYQISLLDLEMQFE